MRVLIDTNILSELVFLKWLKSIEDLEKYMSTVTLMEFAYHLFKKGKGEGRLKAFLDLYSITRASFNEEAAVTAAKNAIDRWDFGERSRDYAIGATAISLDAVLITKNLKDFDWMPKDKVMDPKMFKERYGAMWLQRNP